MRRKQRPNFCSSKVLHLIGYNDGAGGPGVQCDDPFGNGTSLINAMPHSGSSGGPPWSSSMNSGI